MNIINYIKQNSLAFVISIFYVSLGGLVSCSLYPNDSLNGDWWFWGWIITLPVNFLSFALRFTSPISYTIVVIIQLAMFTPTFIVISNLISKKRSRAMQKNRI
jgi:hypothetical protein